MTYQIEFPDFADMPADIPAGLVDSSWRNDLCPSFYIWESQESPLFQWCRLWIDYANPEERDVQNGKRFMIHLEEEDGRVEPVMLWESDDWAETREEVEFIRDNIADILKLARYFAALIRAEYTPDELAEVNRLNATPEYATACATHDFRDSNAFMFGAFADLFFDVPDPSDSRHAGLMNRAWDIARATGFAA